MNTLNSKNFIGYAQSAGNSWHLIISYSIIIHTSASETIREKSFNFDVFNKISKKDIPQNWLIWFIGFAEGEGAILTDVNKNRVRFVLTQKEGKILEEIRDLFGFGTIKFFGPDPRSNKKGHYKWIVEDINNVIKLANLFNGNLASIHRINQLSSWITILNKSKNYINSPLVIITRPVEITLQDPWLSGFTDADGCFTVSVTKNARYTIGLVIKMRFLLDQKNEILLKTVKDLFGFGKVTERKDRVQNYRYTVTGYYNITQVRTYFNIFPLLTKKSFSFTQWCKILDIIKSKEHFMESGIKQIQQLSKLINLKTSEYNVKGSSLIIRKTKI